MTTDTPAESEEQIETTYDHRATYCPEDNKLRFYPSTGAGGDWDDPDFDKEVMKAAGYRWASKQECYVCPRWTPAAEDAALRYVDDIEDENYSPAERAADRAERFSGYRDKRRSEAHGYADTFEAGPDAFGHQNQARAERAAARHDRHRGRALSQWSKAEYWQMRTAGVIRHAIGKQSPAKRRTRIKKLESEQRTHSRDIETSRNHWEGFRKVLALPGNNQPAGDDTPTSGDPRRVKTQGRGVRCTVDYDKIDCPFVLVFTLANYTHSGFHYKHPRTGEESSLYYHLTDKADPITPKEAAELYLEGMHEDGPGYPGGYMDRWVRHYELRLEFERAMLADEGGAADDTEIVPGGFIELRGEMGRWFGEEAPHGWVQIHRVHKSRSTGKASSVEVMGVLNRHCAGAETKTGLVKVDISRFGADRYRAPTAEELAAFNAEQTAAKKKAKAKQSTGPKLINPTPEDAQRLQEMLNALEMNTDHHSETINSTQKAYSSQSKGSYSPCKTITIGEKGRPVRNIHETSPSTQYRSVFKVRVCSNGYKAPRVVIITDKPQKAIPFDAIEKARAECPTEESHGRAFAELWNRRAEWGYSFGDLPEDEREAAKQLRRDCGYLGWAKITCANQFDLTEEGRRVLAKWKAIIEQEQTATPAPKPAEHLEPVSTAAAGQLF